MIISDYDSYKILKKKLYKNNFKEFNDYSSLNKIIRKKLDYTMSAIGGLEGLNPTKQIIKHTKLIAIANKESIICAWNILNNELKKNHTKFIPVDS